MSSNLKSISKKTVTIVYGVLIVGLVLCVLGLFAPGNMQYLSPVGLGVIILAIVLQNRLISCPYCGHRTVTKFYSPNNRTDVCPNCNKRFRIQ